MKIARETWIIMAIGLADLATTILFIRHHGAEEANPLFKRYWEMGLSVFVLAKIVLLVGPLTVLEWARHRRPQFVSWALRSAIVAYVVMYGVGFARLNTVPRPEVEITDADIPPVTVMPHLSGHFSRALRPAQPTSSITRAAGSGTSVTVY